MAYITFYDCTQIDKSQLENLLATTDHSRQYEHACISRNNLHPDTEILSVFVSSTVSREIMEQLPRLRLIACRSTGFNNIDLTAAKERGIRVVTVPSYGQSTVAEFAFGLVLTLSRKLQAAIQAGVHSDDHAPMTGFDLEGRTFAVIGMGNIGQHAARIAKGFGMRVIAYDPYPNTAKATEIGYQYVSLDEIAAQGDVISLHAPATKDNHHLINETFLHRVKPSAILINTARGELVDTSALAAALQKGELAGAALDVVEHNEATALKDLPNCIVTPHVAYNTAEAIARINATTIQNIQAFEKGVLMNEAPVTNLPTKNGKLMLARHGESEWNVLGKWTGTTDVHLTEKGFAEAAQLGELLTDLPIHFAYCSQQMRTLETLENILDGSKQYDVQYDRSSAINERDYGDYTGMNKWEVRDKVGEAEFNAIRRNWDHPVPNGETLKMVFERVIPFYQEQVLPKLRGGKNVLLVAHGNSIRALIKFIEDVSDEGVADVEMPFGKIIVYDVTREGKIADKEERVIDIVPPNA